MNIGIICGYPIPYGMAATTRIFSYSKGLVANGDNVDVWSIIPNTFDNQRNRYKKGVFNGVSYFYSYKGGTSENLTSFYNIFIVRFFSVFLFKLIFFDFSFLKYVHI